MNTFETEKEANEARCPKNTSWYEKNRRYRYLSDFVFHSKLFVENARYTLGFRRSLSRSWIYYRKALNLFLARY